MLFTLSIFEEYFFLFLEELIHRIISSLIITIIIAVPTGLCTLLFIKYYNKRKAKKLENFIKNNPDFSKLFYPKTFSNPNSQIHIRELWVDGKLPSQRDNWESKFSQHGGIYIVPGKHSLEVLCATPLPFELQRVGESLYHEYTVNFSITIEPESDYALMFDIKTNQLFLQKIK